MRRRQATEVGEGAPQRRRAREDHVGAAARVSSTPPRRARRSTDIRHGARSAAASTRARETVSEATFQPTAATRPAGMRQAAPNIARASSAGARLGGQRSATKRHQRFIAPGDRVLKRFGGAHRPQDAAFAYHASDAVVPLQSEQSFRDPLAGMDSSRFAAPHAVVAQDRGVGSAPQNARTVAKLQQSDGMGAPRAMQTPLWNGRRVQRARLITPAAERREGNLANNVRIERPLRRSSKKKNDGPRRAASMPRMLRPPADRTGRRAPPLHRRGRTGSRRARRAARACPSHACAARRAHGSDGDVGRSRSSAPWSAERSPTRLHTRHSVRRCDGIILMHRRQRSAHQSE